MRASISVDLATLAGGLIENATLTGAAALKATGNAGVNHLIGNDGANTLDGGDGADILEGGKGADIYMVDDLGDQVTETLAGAAGGIDLVKSEVSFTLGANLEKLTLLGSADIDATGNTLNNTLLGNAGANILDGGAGNDAMTGGKGDDTYIVDAAGDTVIEAAGGGIDTVESSVTFSLASRVNVENLELTGVGKINGTGNALANVITGNDADNTLMGAAGNDTLVGGKGADRLTGGTGTGHVRLRSGGRRRRHHHRLRQGRSRRRARSPRHPRQCRLWRQRSHSVTASSASPKSAPTRWSDRRRWRRRQCRHHGRHAAQRHADPKRHRQFPGAHS